MSRYWHLFASVEQGDAWFTLEMVTDHPHRPSVMEWTRWPEVQDRAGVARLDLTKGTHRITPHIWQEIPKKDYILMRARAGVLKKSGTE